MKFKFIIQSKELSKEEFRLLIQSIRDCEMKYFPKKEIYIWVDLPELTRSELIEILESIKPPYKFGPYIMSKPKEESET